MFKWNTADKLIKTIPEAEFTAFQLADSPTAGISTFYWQTMEAYSMTYTLTEDTLKIAEITRFVAYCLLYTNQLSLELMFHVKH